MYRRILVPVDGSPTSKLGLKHALGLAKDQGARVRILNVVEDILIAPVMGDVPAADMTMIYDSMKAAGEKALKEAAALVGKTDVNADTALIEAHARNVSDVILGDAKKWRADLIVMGTHGRRGLNRLLLGSDAERVLREAPVPVLLVRAEEAKPRRARKR